MQEIGGYIELDQYNLPMLHEDAVAFNCGRNCLAYLIRAKKIRKIALPYFLCDSVRNVCQKEKVHVRYYCIDKNFVPYNLQLDSDEWLYLVNYYGQLSPGLIESLIGQYQRVILDHAQAYFEPPVEGIDTIYTCRKFFGVPDGAFLYTDSLIDEEFEIDESFERMHFLLGRFERSASEFYKEYAANNQVFASVPVRKMSNLTLNLLHGIDYENIKKIRSENYNYLYEQFWDINRLEVRKIEGAFAYPLWIKNGYAIRKKLIDSNIYIPTLWPNVLQDVDENSMEYDFAKNILPIPVDQRYTIKVMEYLVEEIKKCID